MVESRFDGRNGDYDSGQYPPLPPIDFAQAERQPCFESTPLSAEVPRFGGTPA